MLVHDSPPIRAMHPPAGRPRPVAQITRYRVLFNPHAAHGRAASLFEELRRQFCRQSLSAEFDLCHGFVDARRLSRQANANGSDVVVAVGGDGTLNAVLNGFYHPDGRRLSQARLGVIHVGTSPDFCRSYGVPLRLETAVETLAQAHTQPLFPGRIVCRRDLKAPREEPIFFACCANLGLGAQVAQFANAGVRRRWGDRLGTFWSVLRAVAQDAAQDLVLEIDGQERIVPQVTNVSIGRTQHLASGLKIRHALGPGRSGFYLLVVSRLTPRRLVSLLWKLYSGAALPTAGAIALAYGQTIQVRAVSGPVAAECDGDPIGWCPARVDMARDPIPLLTPPVYAA